MTADPLAPTAERLGMSSASLYTLVVGAVVALALTVTGPTAAFSTRATASPANAGLGDLAVAPPTAPPPTTAAPAVAVPTSTTSPAPTAPSPTFAPLPAPTPAPTTTTTLPSASPVGPQPGDVITAARVPGRATAVASVAGGVIVAVDRDDADPIIVRLDLDGSVVGSIVLPGRDLAADTDIVDIDVDSFGRVVALVNGPAEVLRIDREEIESLGVLGDLPPCALPIPLPIACEPGTDDHAIDVDSVAITNDRVVVSDPGQGVLWSIDGDGTVAARIDESLRAVDGDEPSTGLRGIVSRPDGSVLGAVDAALVEFTFGDDEVSAATIRELDAPGSSLSRTSGGLFVLDDDGRVTRYDRSLSIVDSGTVRSSSIVDVSASIDGLWAAEPASGGATSDIDRYLLEERIS